MSDSKSAGVLSSLARMSSAVGVKTRSAEPPVERTLRAIDRNRTLMAIFATFAGLRIARDLVFPYHLGFDARLYTEAARVWLAGGDPWSQQYEYGLQYAPPPPSLLVSAPFTLLPTDLAAVVIVVLSAIVAFATVRYLRLPAFWILFMPILDGILVGSLDILTMGLLILAGGRLSSLAPLCKLFAFVPMVGEDRWRALLVTGLLIVVTAPLLPWAIYVHHFAAINSYAAGHTMTTSVFGMPILMALMAVALLSLGRRKAGWLAVPVLWPWTQPHYAAIAIPVVATSTILAIGFDASFIFPWAPALAVLGYALAAALSRGERRWRPTDSSNAASGA